ncbi:agmatine deiminase [Raphidocelis subcapitata]|uniref:Agmatine deiminase n=1 Tax=Raphidocelis subcapitata TaxID=307507 RepID=A0A2V0NYS8_9CHLO|nr:agmatine deiminase [Raphidocelis subcapitata]|eukprot:GBF91832.1 agmatine deiminase [Raphidocelis subcapitata]
MQPAQQAVVGQIRLLGRAGVRAASSAAASTSARATVTLPNGKQLDLADGDIKLTMPAEWHPHAGTWMAWPTRFDVWRDRGAPARAAFVEVIKAISQFEPVTVIAHPNIWGEARAALPDNVRVVEMCHDDSWLRDSGPTVVLGEISNCPQPTIRTAVGVDWLFNGWGDLYGSYEQDRLVARKICEVEKLPFVSVDMVLEGGSIHVDGEGTLLTTEECLLNPNRNPDMTKAEIEASLKRFTGVTKVIWLPKGLAFDEDTNGHIDNFACFARPGVVLLAWCDDEDDPQYDISREALEVLSRETDAKGRKLEVIKLPCPPVLTRTQEEWETLDEVGRANRHTGERLAASYVNFYLPNGGVIMPAFGLPEADARAKRVLEAAFPDRRVVAVQTREVVLGGGNVHCITQQAPLLP